MKPLFNNVVVEKTEDDGMLAVMNDRYLIVRIIALPSGEISASSSWCVVPPPVELKVGQKVLVSYVRDYIIDDRKVYVVKLQDIVGII